MFNSDRIEALESQHVWAANAISSIRERLDLSMDRISDAEYDNSKLRKRIEASESAAVVVANALLDHREQLLLIRDYITNVTRYLGDENSFVSTLGKDLDKSMEAIGLIAEKLGVNIVTQDAVPARIEMVEGQPEKLVLEKALKAQKSVEFEPQTRLLAELPDGTFKIRVEQVPDDAPQYQIGPFMYSGAD